MNPESSAPVAAPTAAPVATSGQAPTAPVVGASVPVTAPSPSATPKPRKSGFGHRKTNPHPASTTPKL